MRTIVTFNEEVRKRPRLKWLLLAFIAAFWVPNLVSLAAQVFDRETTSRDVSVHVLKSPYIGSDVLVYEWRGDVFRSCSVTIERQMIDAKGYEYRLKSSTFPPLPEDSTGPQVYPITVETPASLPEGTTTYLSREISRCGWFQRYIWPASLDYPPVTFTVTHSDN